MVEDHPPAIQIERGGPAPEPPFRLEAVVYREGYGRRFGLSSEDLFRQRGTVVRAVDLGPDDGEFPVEAGAS
jgi:hypothetical protein